MNAQPSWSIPPLSSDPVVEAENVRLHEIHDAGYEANYDGELISANPHPAGSLEHRVWESGHLQAQDAREEWEHDNNARAQRAAWREGMDLGEEA